MRCKNHYTDLSSNVGVCASCLRERLFPLAINQHQTQTLTLAEQNHNSDTNPDPLFPRSVSPYITRPKTDTNHHHIHPDRRFFSTPEVAPITGTHNPCEKKKQKFIRFSLLSNLFRSKKRNENPNPRSPVSDPNHRENATSAMSSPFRFSNANSGGDCRKKQPYCSDRGMSPVRYSDCDRSDVFVTCESRKPRTPAHPAVRHGGGKNVSGISFCLSPLVRVSPCRNWKQKGVLPVDSGEIRVPVKAHLSNTRLFCANRSRKVADFGRLATNR